MKDLKEKVVRGGFAKIGTQVASLALRLGSLAILARLLDPKDFGLIAMVTAIVGVLNLFKDAGLSMATIQRLSISTKQMSTLFWINVLVGVLLASLLSALAPLLAAFYNEPRLLGVTLVLALEFLFVGITAQHAALLQRQMRFGSIALIDIISLLAGIAVAINMAASGWGYWSLVGQSIATVGICTLCTWDAVRWVPGLPSREVGVSSMLRFGGFVTLNNLVVYIAYNLEKVLLGRFWGAEALGIYGRAYQLICIPTDTLNSSIFGIAFSALSRIQDDPKRQKNYFLKGYSLLLAVTLPVTIACAVFANDMIIILLGAKWKDSVPIFQLLAPTILIFALINPFAWLLYSTGRAGRSLKIAFVIAPLVIASYFIGLPYGPKGVALAYSVAMSLWVVPHIAWCIHGTGISGLDMAQTISKPLVSGIVASGVAVLSQYCLDYLFTGVDATITVFGATFNNQLVYPLIRLFVGGGVMLAFYLWMLLFIMRQRAFYTDLVKSLKRPPTNKATV
jgi:O-antigen/teichoic acid export membrane protein